MASSAEVVSRVFPNISCNSPKNHQKTPLLIAPRSLETTSALWWYITTKLKLALVTDKREGAWAFFLKLAMCTDAGTLGFWILAWVDNHQSLTEVQIYEIP